MRVPKIQETCDEELKCTENQEPNEEEQTRSNIQESEDEESICRLDRERDSEAPGASQRQIPVVHCRKQRKYRTGSARTDLRVQRLTHTAQTEQTIDELQQSEDLEKAASVPEKMQQQNNGEHPRQWRRATTHAIKKGIASSLHIIHSYGWPKKEKQTHRCRR